MVAKGRVRYIMIFVIAAVLAGLFCLPSFSKEEEKKDIMWAHIVFSSQQGSYKFFDPSTGSIYDYSSSNGKIRNIWTLVELGKDLQEIR